MMSMSLIRKGHLMVSRSYVGVWSNSKKSKHWNLDDLLPDNTNSKHLKSYSIMGEHGNAGFPSSPLIMESEWKPWWHGLNVWRRDTAWIRHSSMWTRTWQKSQWQKPYGTPRFPFVGGIYNGLLRTCLANGKLSTMLHQFSFIDPNFKPKRKPDKNVGSGEHTATGASPVSFQTQAQNPSTAKSNKPAIPTSHVTTVQPRSSIPTAPVPASPTLTNVLNTLHICIPAQRSRIDLSALVKPETGTKETVCTTESRKHLK